jgi:hypothetical protein
MAFLKELLVFAVGIVVGGMGMFFWMSTKKK